MYLCLLGEAEKGMTDMSAMYISKRAPKMYSPVFFAKLKVA